MLRPFGPYVIAEEPPGAQESAIFIPAGADTERMRRAVVVEAGTFPPWSEADTLLPGDVIYYLEGHRIGEQFVVALGAIVAFEREA